jgi:purine-cytosine permease-like protein
MAEELNPVFGVEHHGFDHIPEAERNMTIRDLSATWMGANAYLIYFIFGVIVFGLGLNIWQSLVCVVAGNLLWFTVGVASIAGPRSGLPTMTLTRAAFGVLGNRVNGVLAWVVSVAFEALNTVFGVFAVAALLPVLGWADAGDLGKVIALVVVFFLSASIAVLGHATLVWFQRIFAIVLTGTLALVFAYTIGGVDWSAGPKQPLSAGATIALMFVGTAIIGGGGPFSYLFNAADWSRYLPGRTPSRSILSTVSWSAGGIAIGLCVMGVLMASRGDMTDPVAGLQPMVPQWLFILYAVAAIGGTVSNNVITFYASGLTLQAVGVPLERFKATLLDMTVSTVLVVYVVFISESFTTDVNNFVSMLVVWIAPFGGVWLTDGLLRRWSYDAAAIHDSSPSSRYWGAKGVNVKGFAAMLAGVGACLLTINSPVMEGPIASALDGADLSWLVGMPLSAGLYWLMARREIAASAVSVPVGGTATLGEAALVHSS